jgi:hypothetical protein
MNASFPWLDFQYADPEPNFDRSKVLGVAAKLFTVKDHSFCVALDTVAGGKVSLKKRIQLNMHISPPWMYGLDQSQITVLNLSSVHRKTMQSTM